MVSVLVVLLSAFVCDPALTLSAPERLERDPAPLAQAKGDKGKADKKSGDEAKESEAKDGQEGDAAAGDPLEEYFKARGLVRGDDNEWLTPEEQGRLKEGWTRQDAEWVSPDEAAKVQEGLWKCGDKWLSLDEADKYHASPETPWRLRGKHFDVLSTCKRDVALEVVKEADHTWANLERIFGRVPPSRPMVLVLNSPEQYNAFATGSEDRGSPDIRGFSSLHGAFFAELWLEPLQRGYFGGAIAYFDASNDNGWRFGRTFVRHAAGHSFAEALDPSLQTLSSLSTKRWKADDLAKAFWGEKQLPEWFRYGAASYVERYAPDPTDAANPNWPLKWSAENIVRGGGLDPLKTVFALELDLDKAEGSSKLITEAGLLVAFVVDGKCKPVVEKHAALMEAIRAGKNVDKAGKALEDEIKKNESKLRAFGAL